MRLIRWRGAARPTLGQALTEFAMVFPLFLLLLFSLIVLGLYVFYNQQLENAAREAARYAAIHSSTAQCPTVARINPILSNQPISYFRCDAPEDGWPRMTAAARTTIWGMDPTAVTVTACWSGLVDTTTEPDTGDVHPSQPNGVFTDCTMNGVNPRTNESALACPAPIGVNSIYPRDDARPDGDDKASNIAAGVGTGAQQSYPTTVTVYACFQWTPPMSGFLLVPSSITVRAVVTEALQRQQ